LEAKNTLTGLFSLQEMYDNANPYNLKKKRDCAGDISTRLGIENRDED